MKKPSVGSTSRPSARSGTAPVSARCAARRAQAKFLRPALAASRRAEIWIDDTLVGRLGNALFDGLTFGAVIRTPFITPGSHELTLREPGGRALARRHVQVVHRSRETPLLVAHRVAVTSDLAQPEALPEASVDGVRTRLDGWICGPWGASWRSVALVDVAHLAAGRHEVTLRFRHNPPHSLEMWRVARPAAASGAATFAP